MPAADAPAPRVRATRPSATVRAGGRSARIVARVLESTLEVLGRDGYVGLRIEDVAGRAGVNKTTIYRRWPTPGRAGRRGPDPARRSAQAPEIGRLEPRPARAVHERDDAARDAGRARRRQRPDRRARRSGGGSRRARAARDAPDAGPRPARARACGAASCRARTDLDLLLDVLTGAIYGRLRECPDPLEPDWVRRVIRLRACQVWRGSRAAPEACHAHEQALPRTAHRRRRRVRPPAAATRTRRRPRRRRRRRRCRVVTVAPERVAVTGEWIATLDGNVNAQIRPQVSGYLMRRAYREGALRPQGRACCSRSIAGRSRRR